MTWSGTGEPSAPASWSTVDGSTLLAAGSTNGEGSDQGAAPLQRSEELGRDWFSADVLGDRLFKAVGWVGALDGNGVYALNTPANGTLLVSREGGRHFTAHLIG